MPVARGHVRARDPCQCEPPPQRWPPWWPAVTTAVATAMAAARAAAAPPRPGAASPSVGISRSPIATISAVRITRRLTVPLHRRAREAAPASLYTRAEEPVLERLARAPERQRVPGDLLAGEIAGLAHLVGVGLGLEAVEAP